MTLTPAEVAARLRVSVETVTGMLRAGTLPGFRVGRLWRIPEAALDDWMRLAVGVPSRPEVRGGEEAEDARQRRRHDVPKEGPARLGRGPRRRVDGRRPTDPANPIRVVGA